MDTQQTFIYALSIYLYAGLLNLSVNSKKLMAALKAGLWASVMSFLRKEELCAFFEIYLLLISS